VSRQIETWPSEIKRKGPIASSLFKKESGTGSQVRTAPYSRKKEVDLGPRGDDSFEDAVGGERRAT